MCIANNASQLAESTVRNYFLDPLLGPDEVGSRGVKHHLKVCPKSVCRFLEYYESSAGLRRLLG